MPKNKSSLRPKTMLHTVLIVLGTIVFSGPIPHSTTRSSFLTGSTLSFLQSFKTAAFQNAAATPSDNNRPNTAPGIINVPIIVQEALPGGVSGITRNLEPITVGIPIALDSGVTATNQLGLSGSDVAQFRVLAKWPNGNIKWVLVDARASVAAGRSTQILLTSGHGNFGGNNLAQDHGDTIAINTGEAEFTIRKFHFNVFDSVKLSGQSLVLTNNAGGVKATDINGKEYTSTNDDSSLAIIEENGPARAVIKATGALKNGSGARLVDYTLRLHFYKDKSYVKSFVTIRNASIKYPSSAVFSSFEVVVPLTIGSIKTAEYSRSSDSTTISLNEGDLSYLFQGYSKASHVVSGNSCHGWDPPLIGKCPDETDQFDKNLSVGLDIRNNSTILNAMGNQEDWSQGYAGVKDNMGKGVTVAIRWLASNWPAGFEIKGNGETSIELFSKHNSWKKLKLNFSRHEGRELLWDFHINHSDNKSSLFKLQYPLIARAPLSHYQDSRSIFGQTEIATKEQQYQFFKDMNQSYERSSPSLENPNVNKIYRFWLWKNPGGGNQTDFSLNDLMDYLRTGNPGFYLLGEQRTLFIVDTAFEYSDDFFKEAIPRISDTLRDYEGINGPTVDMEHANILSVPLYYYLTGNEAVKEGFNEYGQYLEREIDSFFPYNTIYQRAWARKYRNISFLYEFSCSTGNCNPVFKQYIEKCTNFMLDSRDNPSQGESSPIGRNLDRGYVYWDKSHYNNNGRNIHSFFHTQIFFEAIYQVLRIMDELDWKYPRKLEVADFMLGLSQFFFDEYLDRDPNPRNRPDDMGFLYNYPLDKYITPHPLTPYDASRAGAFLYQHTGDKTYLEKAGALIVAITTWATDRSPSELQDQALIYTYYNLNRTPIWRPLIIETKSDAKGSYTISWTVPNGAREYRVKYSDKPIVEWLGFDKVSRTFKYSPSQYTPFFAAQSLKEQATPLTQGSKQSITATLDPDKQWYFSAKYLSDLP